MSTSILRRYTPSTCTLEIIAKESPLSRWTKQPLLSQAKFYLCFDGPHLPADQHVTIRGDRHQLDVLCDIVEGYVQNILKLSPARFDTLLSLTSSELKAAQRIDADATEYEQTDHGQPYESSTETGIALHASGQLKHILCFGELTTDKSASKSASSIELSTLELFDLANALDDYRTEMLTLPSINRPGAQTSYPWLRIAAVVLLAVGGMTAVMRFLGSSNSPMQTASSPGESEQILESTSPQASQSESEPSVADVPDSAQTDLGLEQLPPLDDSLPTESDAQPSQRSSSPSSTTNTRGSQRQAASPQSSSANSSRPQPVTPPTIPPELAALPPVERQDIESRQMAPDEAGDAAPESTAIAPSSRLSRSQTPSGTSETVPEQTMSSALDQASGSSIPQLDELREFFRTQWQPPSGLTRNLEYRLILNSDGTLQQIEPVGQTSARYLSRVNMPTIGDRVVSPFAGTTLTQIRLILAADGDVEAFIEPQ